MINSPTPPFIKINANIVPLCTVTYPFNKGNNVGPGSFCGFIMYGDAFFITILENSTHSGWSFWGIRIKKDGTFCHFMSDGAYNWRSNNGGDNLNLIQISDNTFIYDIDSSGNRVVVTIPDVFEDQQVFRLSTSDFSILPPCGGTTFEKLFIIPNQNIIAYEYYVGYPLAADIFAAIYAKPYPNAPDYNAVNVGFIANSPSGSDAFDRTNATLPQNLSNRIELGSNFIGFQKGRYYYTVQDQHGITNIGGFEIQYVSNDVPLVCNELVSNYGTYITTRSVFNFGSNQFTNYVPSSGGWCFANSCNTYNPDYFMMATDFNYGGRGFNLFSRSFVCQIFLTPAYYPYGGVLFDDGTFIVQTNSGYPEMPYGFYTGKIDVSQFGLSPIISDSGNHKSLVNYSRPISPNGSFLT